MARQLEALCQVLTQGPDSEGLCRVMASEQNVNSKFDRVKMGVMRAFPRYECVQA